MEYDKKTQKKLKEWQKDIVNQIEAFTYLTERFDEDNEPFYKDNMKKILNERQKHLPIIRSITNEDIECDHSDVKYSKRILSWFHYRRLFSAWSAVIDEDVREHKPLLEQVPEMKKVVQAEASITEQLKRMEVQAKKKRANEKRRKKEKD